MPGAYSSIRTGPGGTISATNDASRGWLYFDLILEAAGVARSESTAAALRELHAFHTTSNLWEHVPAHVPDVLTSLARDGLQLGVVSHANGTLRLLVSRRNRR